MTGKRRKKKLINFVIILILLSCILYVIDNSSKRVKVNIAQKGEIEDKIKVEGILFKDEKILDTKVDGKVKFYYNEGDRVKSGCLVMEVYTDGNTQDLNTELNKIEQAINYKNLNNPKNGTENEVLLENAKGNIQNAVLIGDMDSLYNIVDDIKELNHDIIDNDYTKYSLNELHKLKNNISSSINKKKISYYSNSSGIVSYKFDELEDLYSIEKKDLFSVNDMNILNFNQEDTSNIENAKKNSNLIKIINNFEYYILAKLDNKDMKNIVQGEYLKTRIASNDNKEIAYAYVDKINYGSEESVVVLKYTDYFYRYYDNRYLSIEIIRNTYTGIIINSKAVIEKDDITGVFIKDISNIVKFLPVSIVGENEEVIVSEEGNKINQGSRGTIEINGDSYYTVKNYDQVILQPDKVHEGQILE